MLQTGPGSLLWCEYLSPWVLRKEVQSIVLNDGIDTLTDPGVRRRRRSGHVPVPPARPLSDDAYSS